MNQDAMADPQPRDEEEDLMDYRYMSKHLQEVEEMLHLTRERLADTDSHRWESSSALVGQLGSVLWLLTEMQQRLKEVESRVYKGQLTAAGEGVFEQPGHNGRERK